MLLKSIDVHMYSSRVLIRLGSLAGHIDGLGGAAFGPRALVCPPLILSILSFWLICIFIVNYLPIIWYQPQLVIYLIICVNLLFFNTTEYALAAFVTGSCCRVVTLNQASVNSLHHKSSSWQPVQCCVKLWSTADWGAASNLSQSYLATVNRFARAQSGRGKTCCEVDTSKSHRCSPGCAAKPLFQSREQSRIKNLSFTSRLLLVLQLLSPLFICTLYKHVFFKLLLDAFLLLLWKMWRP